MRFSIIATAAVVVGITAALPTSTNHVLHEKRSGSSSWSPRPDIRLDKSITLPVRIGLTENNLHLGDDILMRASDPTSEHVSRTSYSTLPLLVAFMSRKTCEGVNLSCIRHISAKGRLIQSMLIVWKAHDDGAGKKPICTY